MERLRASRWSQDTELNRQQTDIEREAADEITRLRAEKADLLNALKKSSQQPIKKQEI